MAYAYRYPITINHSIAGGTTLTNFTIQLVQQTWMGETPNGLVQHHVSVSVGGGVRSFNVPADLKFTSDINGTTLLSWEWEDWDSSAGANGHVWIKIPSISSSVDTVIYCFVGDSGVTTNQSTFTSAWDSSYIGVYHLPNGTTLYGYDSTSNGLNGTNSTSAPTAVAGKVGQGGGGFVSASSQYLDLSTSSTLNPAAITISLWAKATSFPNSFNAVYCRGGANQAFYIDGSGIINPFFSVTGSGSFMRYSGGGGGSHTLSTGVWNHICIGYDSTTGLVGYVNSASDGTNSALGTLDTSANSANNSYIAGDSLNGRYWDGSIDEVKIANVLRVSDWVTAEYRTSGTPASYYTVGSQVSLLGGFLPIDWNANFPRLTGGFRG